MISSSQNPSVEQQSSLVKEAPINKQEKKRKRRWDIRKKQKFIIKDLKQILKKVRNRSEQTQNLLGIKWRDDDHGFIIQDESIFQNTLVHEIENKNYWTLKQFYKKLNQFPFVSMNDYFPKKSFIHQRLNRNNLHKIILSKQQLEAIKNKKPPKNSQKQVKYSWKNKKQRTQRKKKQQDQDSSSPQVQSYSQLPYSNNHISDQKSIQVQERKFSQMYEEQVQQSQSIQMKEKGSSSESQNQQNLTQQIQELNQEYDKYCAQIFFCRKINENPHLKCEDVMFKNNHSKLFRSVFFQKLHQHNIKKLRKLIRKMKTSQIIRKKLPYTIYINQQNAFSTQNLIKHEKVSQKITMKQTRIKFSQNALQLRHDGVNVDMNEFFKYDWSKFEVMTFNNCNLRTADWVKLSRNALQMLPNLKYLELNSNKIQIIRPKDLRNFPLIYKIQLKKNKINNYYIQEIQNYSKQSHIIIEAQDNN